MQGCARQSFSQFNQGGAPTLDKLPFVLAGGGLASSHKCWPSVPSIHGEFKRNGRPFVFQIKIQCNIFFACVCVDLRKDFVTAASCQCSLRYLLGLRHPDEEAYGMLTTLLLMTDQARFQDPIALRSAYLATKSQAKAILNVLRKAEVQPDFGFLQGLPLNPQELEEGRLQQAFGDRKAPATMPSTVKLEQLQLLKSMIPLRSTNASISLQIPTTAMHGVSLRGSRAQSTACLQMQGGFPTAASRIGFNQFALPAPPCPGSVSGVFVKLFVQIILTHEKV